MPNLSFREKIDAIIKTNPYKLGTPHAIERWCKLSNSTLTRAYKINEEPSIINMKIMLKQLRIPRSWWDNPVGEPFLDFDEEYKLLAARVRELEREKEREKVKWELEKRALEERLRAVETTLKIKA